MSQELPILKLKMSYNQGDKKPYITSACKELDALFELLGRKYLVPTELPTLHKMGYQLQYQGDLRAPYDHAGKQNIDDQGNLNKEFFDKK